MEYKKSNSIQQNENNYHEVGKNAIQLKDNRSQTLIQRKIKKAPIQRFVGTEGTNQAGINIPIVFAPEFIAKHIANDESGAIANTQTRIDDDTDGGGQMITAGNIGNSVATLEDWTAAINENNDVIPELFIGPDEVEITAEDYDPDTYIGGNEEEYIATNLEVEGWDVRLIDNGLKATKGSMKKKVSGKYIVKGFNVSMEINHCTQWG